MSKDYENADNFVINGGKNLSAAFFTLSLRVSGMLKREQIRQGKKAGFHSTKSIKATSLNYLIVSRKYRQSTPSGSGGLFSPPLIPPPEIASAVNNKKSTREQERVLLRVASQYLPH